MEYPAQAIVDLGAISANVRAIQAWVPGAGVLAVVKGDAYGHGLIPVARAAVRGGATWLGVAQVGEAVALREAREHGGLDVPVLAWLYTPGTDFDAVLARDIDLAVSAVWALEAIVASAQRTGRTARIHIEVDTGLGRNGVVGEALTGLLRAAVAHQAAGHLRVVGIMTQLAVIDDLDHPAVSRAMEIFAAAVAEAEALGAALEVRHMANSAAAAALPEAAWDLVRVGVSTVGMSPLPERGSAADYGLVPALTLRAEVSMVKRVPAGTGVSYGHSYTTTSETTLVNVPVGYADGIPREAGNRAQVLIHGQRFTVAGQVCMDQFMVDVGDVDVQPGDEVLIFGPGSRGEPIAYDWGAAVGAHEFEVTTCLGPRVPRVYLDA